MDVSGGEELTMYTQIPVIKPQIEALAKNAYTCLMQNMR